MGSYLISNKDRTCIESGCSDTARTRLYCKKHYTKHYRLGDFDNLNNKPRGCVIGGCERKHAARGYCSLHYHRLLKYGDTHHSYQTEQHRMSTSQEYCTWSNIKDRCMNKNNKSYKNYGGRGIFLCDKWSKSFLAFYHDMGPKPCDDMQIDRIDNDGPYSPSNCRWTTRNVNARNRRSNVITLHGVEELRARHANGESTYSLSIEYGMSYTNAKDIVNNKIWMEAI